MHKIREAQLSPNLQIFNLSPDEVGCPGPSKFTLFSELPPELRQKIWRHSLEKPRMIKLLLRRHQLMDLILAAKGEGQSQSPSASQGGPCAVVVGSHHRVLSKLLRVNNEARETALRVYRVHLPCRMTKKDDKDQMKTAQGILYINPEYDFITLKTEDSSDIILPFIHYFQTVVDPRRVGILNLAIDYASMSIICSAKPRDYEPSVRESVTSTLRNLRQLFFIHISPGREVPGLHMLRNPKPIINRSYPIMAGSSSFQRIPRDPRAIGLDLKIVWMSKSVPVLMDMWRQIQETWGLIVPAEAKTETEKGIATAAHDTQTPAVDIRHLVACDLWSNGEGARDREHAEAKLKEVDDYWIKKGQPDWYSSTETWGDSHTKGMSDEQLREAAAVKPAFGFWLFPEKAVRLEDAAWGDEFSIIDFTGYWPELGLWNLD